MKKVLLTKKVSSVVCAACCVMFFVTTLFAADTKAAAPSSKKSSAPVSTQPKTAANDTSSSAKEIDFAEAFEAKYGKGAADSMMYVLRDDYLKCTGDTTTLSRERLIAWKNDVDAAILADKEYRSKFNMFVNSTGIKAHEVRPCEPIVFFERLDKQFNEMDSIVRVERARKERAAKDSALLAADLKTAKKTNADILNIPAGVSRAALRVILNNGSIKHRNLKDRVQIDTVTIDSILVTAAFYFDEAGKYNGYELETSALKADQLDKEVRGWASRLSESYEKKLGPPSRKSRAGFHDIKQGRLTVLSRWDGGKERPQTVVGLATDKNLYYAKIIAQYK